MGREQVIETKVEAIKGGKRHLGAKLTFNGELLRCKSNNGVVFSIKVKDLQAVKREAQTAILASGTVQFRLPLAAADSASPGEVDAFTRAVHSAWEGKEGKGGGGRAGGGFTIVNKMHSPPPAPLSSAFGARTGGGFGSSSRSALHDKAAGKKVNGLRNLGAGPPPPPLRPLAPPQQQQQQQQQQPQPQKPKPPASSSSGLPSLSKVEIEKAFAGADGDNDEENDDNNLFGRDRSLLQQPKPEPPKQHSQKPPAGPGPGPGPRVPSAGPGYARRKYGDNKPSRNSFPPAGPSSSSPSAHAFSSPQAQWPKAKPTGSGSGSLIITTTTMGAGKRDGLRNLGNTCYLNATVQALAAATGFGNDLLSRFWLGETRADLLAAPPATDKGSKKAPRPLRVYGSLLGLLLRLRTKGHGVLDPTPFRQAMAACFPPYGSMRQQDAHEFLGDLLNKLQEELFPYARRHATRTLALEAQKEKEAAATAASAAAAAPGPAGKPPAGDAAAAGGGGKKGKKPQPEQGAGQTSIRSFFTRKPSIDPSVPSSLAAGARAGAGAEAPVALEETVSEAEAAVLEQVLPVTRHFHSEVEKTLTCVGTDCRYSRSYLEPYTDFSVDLVEPNGGGGGAAADALLLSLSEEEGGGGGIPLQAFDLLAHCFQEQELELACERCRKQNKVKVTYRFRRLPHLLVLHLKRFKVVGATAAGLTHQKLQTRVMAPAALDIAALCDDFTLNPRDVDKGLGGAATADVTGPLLDALAPAAPAPASPLPGGGGGGQGGAGGGIGSYLWSKTGAGGVGPGPVEKTPEASLKERLQQKRLGGDGGEKDRWVEQEAAGGGKKRKSEEPLADGANRGKAAKEGEAGGVAPEVEMLALVSGEGEGEDPELQEALRRSMEDQVAVEAQAKALALAAALAATVIEIDDGSTSAGGSSSDMVICLDGEEGEDKENQKPPAAASANASSSASTAAKPVLDLRQLTSRSGQGARAPRQGELRSTYELRSVVRHLGRSANSGHYIADVRESSASGGKPRVTWRRHDDSVVSHLADGDRILQDDRSLQTGYIFVYCAVPPS